MSYNGWKDYETWNVALWMFNTEALYADVMDAIRNNPRSVWDAATAFMANGYEGNKTLDDVEFTHCRVYDALFDDWHEYWNEEEEDGE